MRRLDLEARHLACVVEDACNGMPDEIVQNCRHVYITKTNFPGPSPEKLLHGVHMLNVAAAGDICLTSSTMGRPEVWF